MNATKKQIIDYLKRLIVFLEKKWHDKDSTKTLVINSLAPKILTEKKDVNKIQTYLDNLEQAINTPEINNIALTGSYGSGKSTILKTFQHLNPQYKYLNISLASFKDNKENREGAEFERKLEISILQQMFYHVAPSEIPDSRFKRIINLTKKKLFLFTSSFILWVLSALILLRFDYVEKLNPEGWKLNKSIDWVAAIASGVFFCGLAFFVRSIYRIFRNSKINKLNIKGELELAESIDKSVFNQHLEEILYFFERTDFTVVIIEDVDRFESTDIFTKLREINILINNSDLIRRPVKFIYAIKDEMFKDKNDRVKFFEFIIPIIPFINPSNAGEQLTKLISQAELQDVLSSDFTSDVVTFINDIDMRLLINIFHEYQLYRKMLSNELRQDNLFSLIVYKNLYPDDFGDLQKRRGRLYDFFASKSTYIEDIIAEYESKINTLSRAIEALNSESDKSIKELRAIYFNKVISKLNGFSSFYVNKDITIEEALEDEYFSAIKNAARIEYSYFAYSYGSVYNLIPARKSDINFSKVASEVSPNVTYEQREKILKEKADNQVNFLKGETEKLKIKITEIELLSVREIFEIINVSEHLNSFKDNSLMRNLLLNGYIDENYDDYISLFHEVNLTKEDYIFERKVKSAYSLPLDYSITNFQSLLKRLPDKYFKKDEILNYDLLGYLIKNHTKFKTKLDYFFGTLGIDKERQFEFIDGFIKKDSDQVGYFIQRLCIFKPTLWGYLYTKSGLPDDRIRQFVKHIFHYADFQSILKFTELDSLVQYLEELPDFFLFSSELNYIENIKQLIINKNLKFTKLDSPLESQEILFDLIHSKNHYKINSHNVFQIIKAIKTDIDLQRLESSNYSTILELDKNTYIHSYINNNIEEYVNNVMVTLSGNNNESEQSIISILNHEDVSINSKERILASQNVIMSSLSDIDDYDTMVLLFSYNKIQANWDNVFLFFEAGEETDSFNDVLINFLNEVDNYESLSKEMLNGISDWDDDFISKFSNLLLECEDLNDDAYTSLLNSLPESYDEIVYDRFTPNRLDILLDKQVLNLSVKNFEGLKTKGRRFSNKLVEINQEDFVNDFSDYSLDDEDWINIFRTTKITQENKIALIQEMDDLLIINNNSIATVVGAILPRNKFIPIRYEVLKALINTNNPLESRIGLLLLHFDNLDNDQIESLVTSFGEDYARVFMKQNKPVFVNSQFNFELFSKLKNRGSIIRFLQDQTSNTLKVFAKY